MANRTPLNYKPTIYSDFRTDFQPHPITGDIALVTNEDSVVQALRNLMETTLYEKPWHSKVGGGVRGMLFENPSAITEDAMKNDITLLIKNYEQRANLIDIQLEFRPDRNSYAVQITFAVSGKAQPVSFTHFLQRTR